MTADRNKTLHVFAWLTAIATFPLIFMGGLVTSHQAGMSVPDWPNSYGYNMFLFPPNQWVGGIFYEHTHRLMATVVGFLSIILTVVAWLTEKRHWVRWLCTGVLGMVIFQGVLGGLRVVWVNLNLAIVHACTAQAFFCLATFTAIVTSRWWESAPPLAQTPKAPGSAGRRIIQLATIAVIVIYAQLIVGATMRHFQAGLAIPDLPLMYGKWLPPMSQADVSAINFQRRWYLNLPDVSMTQIWLHIGHRFGAVIVSVATIALAIQVLRLREDHGLRRFAIGLLILLVTQVSLGVFVVLKRKPADITSLHVAVGALTLMTTFVILIRSARLYSPRSRVASDMDLLDDVHGAAFIESRGRVISAR